MTADVCLLLEGTYPFVPGGVSSWVHRIIRGMPERTFALVHLAPRPDSYAEQAFDLPDNVVSLTQGSLMIPAARRQRRAPPTLLRAFADFTTTLRTGAGDGAAALAGELDDLQGRPELVDDILHCRATWAMLRDAYLADAPDESFVDYYWHWLGIYRPLLNVLTTPVPDAGCYHSISTGYAGILAALARHRTGRPMLLTEHGIYTKERRIEIHAAEWIRDDRPGEDVPALEAPFFRRQWNRQFEHISRTCYAAADRVITLYEGNRQEQLRSGADAERTSIVANGIDLELYAAAAERHAKRLQHQPFTVAFAGRVAPIKDLRTFVSAARLVARAVPNLVVRVLGPTSDDPDYAAECHQYVSQIGLDDVIHFEGSVVLAEALADVDVLVLTSISEAQPLVVLEAGAVGVPVVCTDVGACSELVHGATPDDRRLGSGGLLTPIASPGATAQAILELWRDPQLRRRLGENLYQRVRRHYTATVMLRSYCRLYDEVLATHLDPSTQEN